jgi:hypothetical protein
MLPLSYEKFKQRGGAPPLPSFSFPFPFAFLIPSSHSGPYYFSCQVSFAIIPPLLFPTPFLSLLFPFPALFTFLALFAFLCSLSFFSFCFLSNLYTEPLLLPHSPALSSFILIPLQLLLSPAPTLPNPLLISLILPSYSTHFSTSPQLLSPFLFSLFTSN